MIPGKKDPRAAKQRKTVEKGWKKGKRTIVVFLILAVLAFCAAAAADYYYKVLEDGTVEFTKYTGKDTAVTIPSLIDGKTVTTIGNSAFSSCESLTAVTIPDSVMAIGKNAFSDCHSLSLNIGCSSYVRQYAEDSSIKYAILDM